MHLVTLFIGKGDDILNTLLDVKLHEERGFIFFLFSFIFGSAGS
jgi:hypothetical protein